MNKNEVSRLKRAYKQERDAKVRERLLMMLYTRRGESSREVGERLQCDQKLVFYWKQRYLAEGLEGLKTRPRSGKPRQLSSRQEERIKAKVAVHDPARPWTTKRVADLVYREAGVRYTRRHVQRLLHRWNLGLVSPRPTFWQKASGEEIRRFWKKNPETPTPVS